MNWRYWLVSRFPAHPTSDARTTDNIEAVDAKRLACLLAWWLALYGPRNLRRYDFHYRKQMWVAMGKRWIASHPEFGSMTECCSRPAYLPDFFAFDDAPDGEDTRL